MTPAETFWKSFLRSRADRGQRGVNLVIADDQGLARRGFLGVSRHNAALPGRVHWMCNALAHVRAKQRPGVVAMIKTIFAQETAQELGTQRQGVSNALRNRAPQLTALDRAGSSRHETR